MAKEPKYNKVDLFDEHGNITEAALVEYAHGKLAPEQQQEVDKHLKEDEFARDALEGIQMMESARQTEKVLDDLKEQIRDKSGSEAAAVPYKIDYMRLAAAVAIFLVLGGSVLYIAFNDVPNFITGKKDKTEQQELADANKPEEEKTKKLHFRYVQPEAEEAEEVTAKEEEAKFSDEKALAEEVVTMDVESDMETVEKKPVVNDDVDELEQLPFAEEAQVEEEINEDLLDNFDSEPNLAMEPEAPSQNQNNLVGGAASTTATGEGAAMLEDEVVNISAEGSTRSRSKDRSNGRKAKMRSERSQAAAPAKYAEESEQLYQAREQEEAQAMDTQLAKEQTETPQMSEGTPEFPGGDNALENYLKKNINYPRHEQNIGMEGTVYVKFTVDENGNVQKPKVVSGVTTAIDRDAKRVVEEMPQWKPAKKDGKPVKSEMTVQVKYRLD